MKGLCDKTSKAHCGGFCRRWVPLGLPHRHGLGAKAFCSTAPATTSKTKCGRNWLGREDNPPPWLFEGEEKEVGWSRDPYGWGALTKINMWIPKTRMGSDPNLPVDQRFPSTLLPLVPTGSGGGVVHRRGRGPRSPRKALLGPRGRGLGARGGVPQRAELLDEVPLLETVIRTLPATGPLQLLHTHQHPHFGHHTWKHLDWS